MREHLEHLLAALALLGMAVFISYFSSGPVLPRTTVLTHVEGSLTALPTEHVAVATTSLPAFTISPVSPEALFPTHPKTAPQGTPTLVATTTFLAPRTQPIKNVGPKVVAVVAPVVTPPPTPTSSGELGVLAHSVVNIICIAHDGTLRSLSGSGVVIDSRGIILTVAHVAQDSLLQEYLGKDKVLCTIRTGSPARAMYTARPIYISDAWVHAHATTLISSQPIGTGEHDYALLAITGTVSGKALPGAYPAIALSRTEATIGDPVSIGSYGAQNLTSAQIQSALVPTLVTSAVKARYTFGGNTQDVLGISGSAASQAGSSGGAVVNADGELIGIITTSETSGDVASREMRVITPSYIRRSFEEDTGKNFDSYFGDTSLATLVSVYATTASALGEFVANTIGL